MIKTKLASLALLVSLLFSSTVSLAADPYMTRGESAVILANAADDYNSGVILVMSRDADLYLLDEPMGGVDPATRDYILNTIISNYRENSSVVISTHLIADVEKILDEVIFISSGEIVLQDMVDSIREKQGKSVDALFREVFRC